MADNHDEWVKTFLAEIYEKYSARLKIYVQRTLGITEDADDVVGDTFMRFCTMLKDRTPEESRKMAIFGYLRRTAKNVVIDDHRKKKREGRNEASPREDFDDETVQDHIVDSAPLPEEIYEEKEKRERLIKAIEKLPDKFRIVVQRFLEDKTKEEIGEEIGIGTAAVSWRLRKALKILRQMPEVQQIRHED